MTLDRRDFLRASILAATGLALGACNHKPPILLPDSLRKAGAPVQRRSRYGLQVFPGGQTFIAGSAVRVPLGLADPKGATIDTTPATAWFGQGPSVVGPAPLTYRAYQRTAQSGDPHGFYVTTAPLAIVGLADILVEARGLYGTSTVNVGTDSPSPEPGDKAIPFATPTPVNLRGVKNLCTRIPACPMHTERLDQVLNKSKPVVFAIASPKLCSSRTCGPVVDEVMRVRAAHRNQAHFIHAEVYQGDTATTLSPVAEAWNLMSEPWVWVIDGKGIVRARFEGPVVAEEIEPAVRALFP